MFSKPFAIGALVIACVGAAAGGAYVAAKQNGAAPAAPVTADTVASKPASSPVQETEAVVAGQPRPAEPLEQPRPEPETVRSPEPARAERTRAASAPAAATRSSGTGTRARASGPAARESQRSSTASRPASSVPPAPASPAAVTEAPAAATRTEAAASPAPATAAYETARHEPPPPAAPVLDELVVPATAVMGLQVETAVSSERARVEDRVEARVTRDVMAEGRTAVPAGTRIVGSVTLVERGGRVKERARLGVRFHTLVLADGTELPIRTETILREGESPAGDSTRKIGGAAAGGAILGAIIGGKKGAIIGGATGAAGGTAVVMAGDRQAAVLPAGAVVTVRLSAPLTVTVERN